MIGGRSFKKVLQVTPILLSVLGYYFMGFEVDRAQSLILIPLYLSLFFCSYPLIFKEQLFKTNIRNWDTIPLNFPFIDSPTIPRFFSIPMGRNAFVERTKSL